MMQCKSLIIKLVTIYFLTTLGLGCINSRVPDFHFSILLFMNDGGIKKVSPEGSQYIGRLDFFKKENIEDSRQLWAGQLINEEFITFSKNSPGIIGYDLRTNKSEIIFTVDEDIRSKLGKSVGSIDEVMLSSYPNILFKNKKKIIFYSVTISNCFQIDLEKLDITHLPIYDNLGSQLSMVDDSKIYYVNENSKICVYNLDQGTHDVLNITGMFPTVSPNGQMLAYIKSRSISEGVEIFYFNDKKIKKVKSFFINGIKPRLRWSSDSKLIAVQGWSDFSPQPLYIINVETGKVVFKIKDNVAENWFFSCKS